MVSREVSWDKRFTKQARIAESRQLVQGVRYVVRAKKRDNAFPDLPPLDVHFHGIFLGVFEGQLRFFGGISLDSDWREFATIEAVGEQTLTLTGDEIEAVRQFIFTYIGWTIGSIPDELIKVFDGDVDATRRFMERFNLT